MTRTLAAVLPLMLLAGAARGQTLGCPAGQHAASAPPGMYTAPGLPFICVPDELAPDTWTATAGTARVSDSPKLWVGWNFTKQECEKYHGRFSDPYCYGNDLSILTDTLPPGNSYVGTTMPAPDFQTQLDRIEAMLKATCDRQAWTGGAPQCPK
jgi:hypothetical protein